MPINAYEVSQLERLYRYLPNMPRPAIMVRTSRLLRLFAVPSVRSMPTCPWRIRCDTNHSGGIASHRQVSSTPNTRSRPDNLTQPRSGGQELLRDQVFQPHRTGWPRPTVAAD